MQHPIEGLQDLRERLERELVAHTSVAAADLSGLAAALGEGLEADACAFWLAGSIVGWWSLPDVGEVSSAVSNAIGAADSTSDLAGELVACEEAAGAVIWVAEELECTPLLARWWRARLPEARSLLGLRIAGSETVSDPAGWILLVRRRSWEQVWRDRAADLTNALTLAVACWQQQQQAACDARVRQQVSQVCHGATDGDRIRQVSLEILAQALQAEVAFAIMLKYAEPLFSGELQRELPKAKLEILEWWPTERSQLGMLPPLTLQDSPLCGRAWQGSPEPLVVAARDLVAAADPLFAGTGASSVVFAPLTGRGRDPSQPPMVLGFLVLQRRIPATWQPHEAALAAWVAMQLSTAMLHSRTLRRVQDLVDERTAQLQRSLDVQAKLYDTSRQQVEQLRQLNLLKDEFLSTISHELNTPLATMRMAIQMLRQPEVTGDRRDRYLNILEQELKRESNLIGDLLTLQQMESDRHPLQLQCLDLKALLGELRANFVETWSSKRLQVRIDYRDALADLETISLCSETDSLRRILVELLANAGKYSDPDTEVCVVVSQQVAPAHQWAIAVTNMGPGVVPSEREAIFEQFRRGTGATQQAVPGTGLGLALVKCLVQHLQGTITVTGDYQAGMSGQTCFTLTLPETPTVG